MILFNGSGYPLRGLQMLRLNGHFLYEIGLKVHPLEKLELGTAGGQASTYGEAFSTLYVAESAIDQLLNQSVYQLRTSRQSGLDLLAAVKKVRDDADIDPDAETGNGNKPIPFLHLYKIKTALTEFEAVLRAELSLIPMYLVTPKAGYSLPTLIDMGEDCFPLELQVKVSEAVEDLQQGARCIAFELPTAAAFHLHRACESVLLKYWDSVTSGAKRPRNRNMGSILKKLTDNNWGDPKVRASLENLKNFHRNPIIHPEQSIESIDEAIALMNSIHTAVVQMLKEIPDPTP